MVGKQRKSYVSATKVTLQADDIRLFCQSGIYRHFDKNGTLLYVGQTTNFLSRSACHLDAAPWRDEIHKIELEPMSKEEAMSQELEIIHKERPLWNKEIRWSKPPQEVVNDKSPIFDTPPGYELLSCVIGIRTRRWGFVKDGKNLLPLFKSPEAAMAALRNGQLSHS